MDLEDKHRAVTTKEGLSVAYRYKCGFVEASSKSGENVDEIFQEIVREIRKFKAKQYREEKKKVYFVVITFLRVFRELRWRIRTNLGLFFDKAKES